MELTLMPHDAASRSGILVGAGVGPVVGRVIRAAVVVAVEAAASETISAREMTSAREVTSVETSHVASSKASNVTSAEATDVTSAETTDVTSAKAATDVAAAKAAAHVASAATAVASATATATAGLRISGKKAAGKRCTCQNHHYSSYHDISFGMGGPSAIWLARRRRVREGQALASRCTEDGDASLPSPLNSRSMT